MLGIGLDVGTGFVKVVSDDTHLVFPSLYAYRDTMPWESEKKRITAVGKDAQKMSKFPDAVVIRPVQEGRPVDDRAFCAILEFVMQQIHKAGADPIADTKKGIKIIAGLPYSASGDKNRVMRLIKNTVNPEFVFVCPQVLGTLVNQKTSCGIVVSIGQGTTEIVAFDNNYPVAGTSIPQAVDFVTWDRGEFSYLDTKTFEDKQTKDRVEKLADIIANRVTGLKSQLVGDQSVIVSGGGILIPGMQSALAKRIPGFIVAENPVLSNALGMYRLTFEMKC